MYATQYNIISDRPVQIGNICGRNVCLPQKDGRVMEGGLRLQGKYKRDKIDLPLVSIITCVLNREKYINTCIQSVFKQTWKNIEYIIVDGGSTDRTLSVINRYNNFIDYYVSEADNGLYSALNKGLSLAMGKYILILNSDDWYKDDAVEKLVIAVQKQNVDFSSALAAIVDEEGKIIGHIPHYPFDDFVFLRMPLRHELMLVSACIYEKLGGYDTSFHIIGDLEFAQRMRKEALVCHEINEELMYFRTNGISSNIQPLKEERKRLLIRNFPFLDSHDCKILAEMTKGDDHLCLYLLDKYGSNNLFRSSLGFWTNYTSYNK